MYKPLFLFLLLGLCVDPLPAGDGRVRMHYINDRPDNIDVLIKARKR